MRERERGWSNELDVACFEKGADGAVAAHVLRAGHEGDDFAAVKRIHKGSVSSEREEERRDVLGEDDGRTVFSRSEEDGFRKVGCWHCKPAGQPSSR